MAFSSVILPPTPAGVREAAKPGTPVSQREARRKLQRHQQACQQRVVSAEEKADVGCSVSGGVVAERGDDELVVNPPMPCRIGKHPPAPAKKRPASKGRAVEGTCGGSTPPRAA